MHIIVLEDEPSSFRGGQELSLLDVCQGLAQRGHSISLLYIEAGDLLAKYQEFCTQIIKVDGYELDRSRITHTFNFFADIWQISTNNIQSHSIVYCNRYNHVLFGSLLAKAKQIPFVCHLRLPPPPNKLGRPHTLGLKWVSQFITISQQTKLDWVQRGLPVEKIEVIYNAINPDIFKPTSFAAAREDLGMATDTKVVLYAGRMDAEKGLETLIKAGALLLKNNVKVQLLIVGKPLSTAAAYKLSLEQLAIDLGIEKFVKFLGHVSNPVPLYQASDVTVLPSIWSEPFGRTIIESMACGTPVVASQIGGIPEILTGEFRTGLFEPGNVEDLADKLQLLICWRDKDQFWGEKCRQHVLSKFSLNKMIDAVEQTLLRSSKSSK